MLHSGSGDVFVVEADESDGSFLAYQPFWCDHYQYLNLIMSITSPAKLQLFQTFAEFVTSIKAGGLLVVCGDDPGVKKLIQLNTNSKIKFITYGSKALIMIIKYPEFI
jgi:UDP-N-acetylmuramate--alanine ligase